MRRDKGGGPLAACSDGGDADRACRWATVGVWLHPPEVVGGDVPTTTTDRQVCLRCGAARLVRALDGRSSGRRRRPPAPPRELAQPLPEITHVPALLARPAALDRPRRLPRPPRVPPGLHPALWHLAGLAVVLGVGAATAPLEYRRRDHTAHSAFIGS